MTIQRAAPLDGAAPVNRDRSGTPEAWERPQLLELGELLRTARLAAGISWPELEAVVGTRSSLRQVEGGTTRTRASRLRPWLERLGLDPDPVLERFAAVIAPEAADGRPRFAPVAFRAEPPRLEPAPLAPHARAALGAELWRLRVVAGLSRPDLAARVGCSRVAVWLVERGARRPTADLVEAWLVAAGADQVERTLLGIRFPSLISGRPRQFGSALRPRVSSGTRQPRADRPGKESNAR